MWGSRNTGARRATTVATLAVAGLALLAGLAPAAFAQEGEGSGRPDRPRLTEEQRACLQEQGVQKPEGKPTEEQRAAFRAAAEACGIELPPARPDGPPSEAPAEGS